ncbi:hypothetical protein Tco_0023701 [Tanacetum coccineum]
MLLWMVTSIVNLNKLFRSKPCSLTLPPDSPLRIEEPTYEGLRHFLLKMMLFYSKQSKSIRQANVIYRRVVNQVDKPAIYDGKSFCCPDLVKNIIALIQYSLH